MTPKDISKKNPVFDCWCGLRKFYLKKGLLAPEWAILEDRKGYVAFAEYMGERPKYCKIARKNPSKPWQPGNVFWKKLDSSNSKKHPIKDEIYSLKELARMTGYSVKTLRSRLQHMNACDAVSCTISKPRMERLYSAFGESKLLSEWVVDPRFQVSLRLFNSRISKGWNVEKAMSTPFQPKHVLKYTAFGESKIFREWRQDPRFRVTVKRFYSRLAWGWDAERAMSESLAEKKTYTAFGETKTLRQWEQDPRFKINHKLFHLRIRKGWTAERAMGPLIKLGPVECPLVVEQV